MIYIYIYIYIYYILLLLIFILILNDKILKLIYLSIILYTKIKKPNKPKKNKKLSKKTEQFWRVSYQLKSLFYCNNTIHIYI